MARPRYIICSQDQLIDPATGLISHVHVPDRFVLQSQPAPSDIPAGTEVVIPNVPIARMILAATWIKGEDDSESDVFDYETVLHKPGDEPRVMQTGEFRFEKRFFRINAGLVFTTHTKFATSGEMVLESKIKKRGTEAWISQTFVIDIEVLHGDQAKADAPVAEAANR